MSSNPTGFRWTIQKSLVMNPVTVDILMMSFPSILTWRHPQAPRHGRVTAGHGGAGVAGVAVALWDGVPRV